MVEDCLSSPAPLAQDVLISTPSLIDQQLKEITEILVSTAKVYHKQELNEVMLREIDIDVSNPCK